MKSYKLINYISSCIVFAFFTTTAYAETTETVDSDGAGNTIQTSTDPNIVEDIAKHLESGIQRYNIPYFGNYPYKPVAVYMRDNQGHIIAGASGIIRKTYLFVDWAWVDETYRRKNLGRTVFNQLESFAKRQGCKYIHLNTFSFQGVDFYKALGFQQIGVIENWFEGKDLVHFRKEI